MHYSVLHFIIYKNSDDAKVAWFPPGWTHFYELVLNGLTDEQRGQNVIVKIEHGLLRFTAEGSTEVGRRIFQSIARDSATTCMVCSKRGQRRKLEDGWPALCQGHYVEYVNWLAEQPAEALQPQSEPASSEPFE